MSKPARVHRRHAALGLGALVLSGACDPDAGSTLAVDLRTDLVPGVEFVAVRSTVEEPLVSDEAAARREEDFFTGRRVAELRGVPAGTRTLAVALIGRGGEVVVERRVRVQLAGAQVATVLVTRDCREVACPPAGGSPSATSCVGGRCAAPECVLGTEPECPDAECSAARDCDAGAACAEARCEGGVCLYSADHAACAAGEWCEAETGCRPLPDRDAGVPAPDAGVERLVVGDIAPRAGPTGGGTAIDIDYVGHGGGLIVRVDGIPCDALVDVAPGRVRCTVPPHSSPETVGIELVNELGHRDTDPSGFTYQREGAYQYGSAADDNTSGIAVGPDGSVYVSGGTTGDLVPPSGGDYDAYLLRFEPRGEFALATSPATPAYDYARDVAVGPDGTVHLVGYTAGDLAGPSAGGNDVFVTAHMPSGVHVWTRQHGTPGDDQAWDLGVDGGGNIYLAVRTDGVFDGAASAGGVDAALLRLDPSGELVWARQLGTPADDVGHSLAVDPRGHAFLVGYTGGALEPGATLGGTTDLFVARFEADGTLGWIRQRGQGGADRAYDAAVGPGGELYVVGTTDASFDGGVHQGDSDVILLRFDEDGTRRWSTQIGSAAYESSWGVSVGPSGDPYVAGVTGGALHGQPNAGGQDGFVTRFSQSDGSRIWTRTFGTPQTDSPSSCAFDVDYAGLLYVSLNTTGALGGPGFGLVDAAIVRFTADGTQR